MFPAFFRTSSEVSYQAVCWCRRVCGCWQELTYRHMAGEESFEGRSSGTTICQSLDRAGTTRWHHRGDRRPTPAVSGATTREYESAEGPGEPWRRYPGQNRHYDDHL